MRLALSLLLLIVVATAIVVSTDQLYIVVVGTNYNDNLKSIDIADNIYVLSDTGGSYIHLYSLKKNGELNWALQMKRVGGFTARAVRYYNGYVYVVANVYELDCYGEEEYPLSIIKVNAATGTPVKAIILVEYLEETEALFDFEIYNGTLYLLFKTTYGGDLFIAEFDTDLNLLRYNAVDKLYDDGEVIVYNNTIYVIARTDNIDIIEFDNNLNLIDNYTIKAENFSLEIKNCWFYDYWKEAWCVGNLYEKVWDTELNAWRYDYVGGLVVDIDLMYKTFYEAMYVSNISLYDIENFYVSGNYDFSNATLINMDYYNLDYSYPTWINYDRDMSAGDVDDGYVAGDIYFDSTNDDVWIMYFTRSAIGSDTVFTSLEPDYISWKGSWQDFNYSIYYEMDVDSVSISLISRTLSTDSVSVCQDVSCYIRWSKFNPTIRYYYSGRGWEHYVKFHNVFLEFIKAAMLYTVLLLPVVILYKRYSIYPAILGALVIARMGSTFFYAPVVLLTLIFSFYVFKQVLGDEWGLVAALAVSFMLNLLIVASDTQLMPEPPSNPLDFPRYINDILVTSLSFSYLEFPFSYIFSFVFGGIALFALLRLVVRVIRGA